MNKCIIFILNYSVLFFNLLSLLSELIKIYFTCFVKYAASVRRIVM